MGANSYRRGSYSWRSATTGSTDAARCAGNHAAIRRGCDQYQQARRNRPVIESIDTIKEPTHGSTGCDGKNDADEASGGQQTDDLPQD